MVVWMIVFSLVACFLHWFFPLWISMLVAFFIFGVVPIVLNVAIHRRYSAKELRKLIVGWLLMALMIYGALSLLDFLHR